MKVRAYGKTYEVTPYRRKYWVDGSLAILLVEDKTMEPFATLTVNLGSDHGFGKEYQFVDVNNCEWAEQFIKDNNLGAPTGGYAQSGYCSYPLYKFNLSKLEEG